jgi:hypothetical protein
MGADILLGLEGMLAKGEGFDKNNDDDCSDDNDDGFSKSLN